MVTHGAVRWVRAMNTALLIIFLTYAFGNENLSPEMRKSGIYLTISSFNGLGSYGYFEMNWFGIGEEYIGETFTALTTQNPPRSLSDILSLWAVRRPSGRFTTGVLAPNFNISTLMKGQCLGYWGIIMRPRNASANDSSWDFEKLKSTQGLSEKKKKRLALVSSLLRCFPKDVQSLASPTSDCVEVLYSSCFTPKPRWMRDNCDVLSTLTLMDVLIPGTHNSGMYNLGLTLPYEHHAYNQDKTVKQQLAYGIRALDLRVQHTNGKFYATHDRVRGWPTIRQVLQEVREFVDETGELVLLDFHRFTKGFDERYDNVTARHTELVQLIVTELNGVLLKKYDYLARLHEIFGECKKETKPQGHVIVFYNSKYKRGPHEEYLAPLVVHRWPNAQSKQALMEYLEIEACISASCNLISIMAELTASFPKLIAGNRQAAQWINYDVTEYFRNHQQKCFGFISTDFFLGNGIIDVTIEANILRGGNARILNPSRRHYDCNITGNI
ncbi:PI-PLC X domain-containing protein 1-like [Dermacentor albipictus]|uniref:PI-PLC X domain-containing protein 1-like n=1 Tax=Dermacentor albipictus TaxID=60249 RepID=UPI0031FC676E